MKDGVVGSEDETGGAIDSLVPGDGEEFPRGQRVRERRERGDEGVSRVWEEGTYEHNLIGGVMEPFDQDELVRLAVEPGKDVYRLTDLIHRAAAEKDLRFRYLVEQENLRVIPAVDLAVSAYDYAVNGSEEALDHILEIHGKEDPGSDSDSVVTLSYLDEWDRTMKAYETHFAQGTDGAGGDAKYAFKLRREYLFPHHFRKYEKRKGGDGRGD